MSVINKMLQDLEQRQQPDTATAKKGPAPRQDSGRTIYFFGFAVLAIAILVGALWQSRGAQSQNASKLTAEASTVQVPPAVKVSQQTGLGEAEPVSIMAVLAAEPMAAEPIVAVTAEKEPKPETVAEPAVAAQPAVETQVPALTMPRELTPVREKPALEKTSQAAAVAATELASVAKPQMMVDKQRLSAAQQQQNMQQRANASEAAGDTSSAIAIWQQIVSQQPAEANGYLNLARLWLKQQQIITASQVLLQARQNGVISAEINMQLAQLAVRQGQWQQALAFLPDQFELAAQPEYFGMKATVLQQLEQHAAALDWYQRLQQLQPDQGRWSLGAALASEQLGQSAQAHQYYQHAWQYRQALSISSHNFIQQRLKATEP